jgi:hypothetical protein
MKYAATQNNKNGDNIHGFNVNVDKSIFEKERIILNDLHKNIDKLGDLYKLDSAIPKKENKLYYIKVFGVTIVSAIVFWGLAILSYKFFGFEINATNIVLTLVGILATFVVISNYLQVKEVKDEFYNYYKNIEANIRDVIVENIDEHKHIVVASILHLQGFIYHTKNADPDALECCMKALDELNKATDKELMDNIIISLIDILTYDNVIRIPEEQQKEYRKIVIKSGHESTDEILGYINLLDIAPS